MTEKHTPGDWHVSELDATGEKSEYHIFIEPGVAVIERSAVGQYDMADAHLLAASKMMLEALESAHMALIGFKHQNAITLNAINKCNAALAKARGTK